MIFGNDYYNAMDRGYYESSNDSNNDIEKPVLSVSELGQTVAEGRGSGDFIQSVNAAIRKGVSSVELSMSQSGQEPGVGADLYGKEKREEIREIAKVNEINIASVHTPASAVGNLSGLGQRGFDETKRENDLNEVRKAIRFSRDIAEGSAVVVHTGEYQRGMIDQEWNNDKYQFEMFPGEEKKAIEHLVDERNGQVIEGVKRDQVVYEPEYITAKNKGLVGKEVEIVGKPGEKHILRENDWIDIDGNYIDPENTEALFDRVPDWDEQKETFRVQKKTWEDYAKKANDYNQKYLNQIKQGKQKKKTPAEMFIKGLMQEKILQAKGQVAFYTQRYESQKEQRDKIAGTIGFYEKLEKNLPKDEVWKIMKKKHFDNQGIVPPENILPSKYLKEQLRDLDRSLKQSHKSASAAESQAQTMLEQLEHIVPMGDYAKKKTFDSYAQLGIEAMNHTKERNLKKDIFIAPENIFPQMGYGSHPEELIDLVKNARKEMVKRLTSPTIKEMNPVTGKEEIVQNPLYNPKIKNEKQAEEFAKKHIRATLDTEHVGMWKRYLKRKPNETEEQFDKRFNQWYLEEVQKMADEDVIGHVHVADGLGYGHSNLPAGQGTMPIKSAVQYLKEKGYTGALLSEGYGDPQRIWRQALDYFDSPIYSFGAVGASKAHTWTDVQHSYFNKMETPYYVFGQYAPSNDWTLWSQVPFE